MTQQIPQITPTTGVPPALRAATFVRWSSIQQSRSLLFWNPRRTIYTSTDGGKHWQFLYNFGQAASFSLTTLSSIHGIREFFMSAHIVTRTQAAFSRSTDGGATWREARELKNEAVHSLTQSEADPNTLIAGTFNGSSGPTTRARPGNNCRLPARRLGPR